MIVLPVGHDKTTVRRLPWVTFGILATCVGVFAAQRAGLLGDGLLMRWGLIPAVPAPATLLTYMFLHVGWPHVLGNALILYLAGPFIEDVWGRPLFLSFYLASGFVAASFHVGGNLGSLTPLVGASGAIAGVMGAFLVRYGATRIRFFYLLLWAVRGTFSVPAWILLPLWFGQQLLLATLSRNSGVAYWAHVGGFVGGMMIALLMRALDVEDEWIEPVLKDKSDVAVLDNRNLEQGLHLLEEGNPGQATARLRRVVAGDLANPDAAAALWTAASRQEAHRGAIAALLVRSITEQLRAGHAASALDLWSEMRTQAPELDIDLALLLRLGGLLAEDGRNAEARATLRMALRQQGRDTPPAFALRLARIAQLLDPPLALTALDLALANPDLDPGSRDQATRLRRELTPTEITVPTS